MYRSAPTIGPVCDAHPSTPAIGRCARCEAHICAPCGLYADLKPVCPRCAKAARLGEVRDRRRGRAMLALGFAGAAVLSGVMVARRALDPHNWGERRATIEQLLVAAEADPCAARPLEALTDELLAAGDLDAAKHRLETATAACALPGSAHKRAFDLHMGLRQADAAARDASRRIVVATVARDQAELIAALRDRARAYDAGGEPLLAAADDLTVLDLAPFDDLVFARAVERYQRLGDRAGAKAARARRKDAEASRDWATRVEAGAALASREPPSER